MWEGIKRIEGFTCFGKWLLGGKKREKKKGGDTHSGKGVEGLNEKLEGHDHGKGELFPFTCTRKMEKGIELRSH